MPRVRKEREINMQSIEDFQGSEDILYDTTMVDMWLYICQNPQNVHQPPRVNSDANYGLLMIMILSKCQWRFTNLKRCAGEGCDYQWGYMCVGVQGKFLYLSLNFSVNQKTTLKKSLENVTILSYWLLWGKENRVSLEIS